MLRRCEPSPHTPPEPPHGIVAADSQPRPKFAYLYAGVGFELGLLDPGRPTTREDVGHALHDIGGGGVGSTDDDVVSTDGDPPPIKVVARGEDRLLLPSRSNTLKDVRATIPSDHIVSAQRDRV
jgi:hypothetical protein